VRFISHLLRARQRGAGHVYRVLHIAFLEARFVVVHDVEEILQCVIQLGRCCDQAGIGLLFFDRTVFVRVADLLFAMNLEDGISWPFWDVYGLY